MSATLTPRKCLECGGDFTPTRSWQKFCDPKCRWLRWERANPRVPIKTDPLECTLPGQ